MNKKIKFQGNMTYNEALKLVMSDLTQLDNIPESLMSKEFVNKVLDLNITAIRFFPFDLIPKNKLNDYKSITNDHIKLLLNSSNSNLSNTRLILEILHNNPFLINLVNTKFITIEVLNELVKTNPEVIKRIPEKFITFDLVFKAVEKNNELLKYIMKEALFLSLSSALQIEVEI